MMPYRRLLSKRMEARSLGCGGLAFRVVPSSFVARLSDQSEQRAQEPECEPDKNSAEEVVEEASVEHALDGDEPGAVDDCVGRGRDWQSKAEACSKTGAE